jgi:hypothetical protein
MILFATYTTYEILKFWLPIVSAGGIVIKAYLTVKKGVGDWAERLLSNHLVHIEAAAKSTEAETKKTNEILKDSGERYQSVVRKLDIAFENMNEHNEKQLIMWDGVAKTLAVLEDRTRTARAARARKK